MIPEEQLKEWEEFLIHQTPGGLNYQMVAVQVIQTLLPAYREQQKIVSELVEEVETLKSKLEEADRLLTWALKKVDYIDDGIG